MGRRQRLHRGCRMYGRLTLYLMSAAVFAAALLTGPPSFDSTDGAEFAVCGSRLETAHAPGYPLFLMLIRIASMIMTPLYGHLRLINCLLGALLIPLGTWAFKACGASFRASAAASFLFASSAPVMAQLNSLEVYPLAMALAFTAVALRGTRLGPYGMSSSIFAGHPVSVLLLPLAWKGRPRAGILLPALIPATLLLYIPVSAAISSLAHYGHPSTPGELLGYFTMHSGRLSVPSPQAFYTAVSPAGPLTWAVMLALAAAAGRFRWQRDVPIALGVLFLASYRIPDPAGQLWVLLLPLCLRCAEGMDRLCQRWRPMRIVTALAVLTASLSGIRLADRRQDDMAMRWTMDVFASIPPGAVYRPVAHDCFYAAYATEILGMRKDIVLSDPFGNFFELPLPPPVPAYLGDRPVYISRGWERQPDFRLHGLLFIPANMEPPPPAWNTMAVFSFTGHSPDPMAMDLAAEAWARRMVQTHDPVLRDSFYRRAMELAGTEMTGERIENLRDL